MNSKHDLFKSVKPTVNITPLIDVLLVLLIIFMVISPTKPHKLETKTPEKPEASSQNQGCTNPLVISVDHAGKLSINSKPMTDEELLTNLTGLMNRLPTTSRTIFIQAPRALRFESVTKAIDLAKAAGANPIGLQVDFLE